MPVVQTIPPLLSPPTNIFGLYQYLAQRIPGYDPSEYVRELNSAYIHVWEEISKLKNHYFSNTVQVTVLKAQFTYDFQFNADAALSAPVSSRLYQVTRIRVLPPAAGLFQGTRSLSPTDPEFIGLSANPTSAPTQTGPYYWYMNGRNQCTWGLPLAIGTVIEVVYTFWPLALTFLTQGTVSSTGTVVTGLGTNFTQLLQPDFQASQPTTTGGQEQLQVELVCNGNQVYRVGTITSDTILTTASTINPALANGSQYVVGALPEIAREHIRVIASVATAKMYSIAGDDTRQQEWLGVAASNMQMMKDSLIERQSNNPAQKQRFPYGIGRRNRLFMR